MKVISWLRSRCFRLASGGRASSGRSASPVRTRLGLEPLEARVVPSTVVIESPNPQDLGVSGVVKGETIKISVQNWSFTDSDDPEEGEPLVIQSSQGFSQTVSQLDTPSFSYKTVADNETFSAYISGGDGDESVQITVELPGVDLTASINSSHVTPKQAPDLNLLQLFGTEQISVPLTIQNQGTDEAKGNLPIQLYLNATPDLSGSPQLIGTATIQNLDLQGGATLPASQATVTFTVDGSKLNDGQKGYLVVDINNPVSIKENDNKNGQDANNVAATSQQFEYVGEPNNTSLFTGANPLYFQVIRSTLQWAQAGANPFQNSAVNAKEGPGKVGTTDATNLGQYLKLFEGDTLYPYMIGGHVTIGVGYDLVTADPSLKEAVFSDVRATLHLPSSLSDTVVYNLLNAEAEIPVGQRKNALTQQQDAQLLDKAVTIYTKSAQNLLGAAYNNLTALQKVAVVDRLFNGMKPEITRALKQNDLIEAGFFLFDDYGASGDKLRVQAEFENLLVDDAKGLGTLLS